MSCINCEGPPAKRPPHIEEAGFFEFESFGCVIMCVPVKAKSFYKVEMQKNQPKNTKFSSLASQFGSFCRTCLTIVAYIALIASNPASADPLKLDVFAEPLPMSSIMDASGKDVVLADFAGQPLIVNFWATWCAPCIHELPALDRAAEQLADDAALLLVSVDRGGPDKAMPFLRDRNIDTALTAYDPKSMWARALKLRGLPSTLVISADQTSVWLVSGPAEWDTDAVLSQLREQLAETN